jgi:RNA polymerase sigma factor (sigma-70 family)
MDLLEMLAGCRKGDIGAQKALYDRYHPLVFGVIRRYVDDTHLANELLNDVFFAVLTKSDQFQHKGSFEGWIRQITTNTIAQHFRRNAKHERVVLKDVPDEDFFVDTDALDNMGFKELLAIIQELPPMPRAVFNLAVLEKLSHKEIGNILGIQVNNSRWYLNDARKRLKEKIKSR